MASGHSHRHAPRPTPSWGEPRRSLLERIAGRVRALVRAPTGGAAVALPDLPLALRRGELAEAYLDAERANDHRRAAAAAARASERAVAEASWWAADAWAHRALWHFERAGQGLAATRQARRIGDLRHAAGDPASARRYYAETIDEARDIGAEHEQGLAALGLGRSLLDLGEVTAARRLASAAVDLLVRSGGAASEIEAARELLGTEVRVDPSATAED